MTATIPRQKPSDVVLVSGSDNGYAMPLAAMIRSALDSFDLGRRLRLFVLDGGLSACNRQRLESSWHDPRLELTWLRPDVDRVRDLPVSDHISTTAYLRLLMAELLPPDVTRAIYLDADMLVCRDLARLWDEPQGGATVLAVQDLAAPFIDAAEALSNYDRCRSHLAATRPIANYRELGLSGHAPYFNSGLLVIDIARWRTENLGSQVLDCLRTHREHVLWWDQYALNVVLANCWRALDHRWNQGAHVYVYPNSTCSPFPAEQMRQIRDDPWIVHFCSPSKPWNYFCSHPSSAAFRQYLRRTAWSDWRPALPADVVQQWLACHYQPVRRRWKGRLRAFKAAIGSRRQRAA